MGIAYNNSIVRDGLVLHLDAANPKSYPGSGTTWKDLSGNGNNGNLINGVSYSSDNKGKFSFDGNDDRADFLNPTTLQLSSFSLDFWVYFNSVNGSCLVSKRTSYLVNQAFNFFIFASSNKINLDVGNTRIESEVVNSGTWYNLLATYDSSSLIARIYKNSTLIRQATNISNISDNSADISIGCLRTTSGNAYHLNGDISLCSIYNKALSEEEVKKNFNSMRDRYGI